MPRGIINFVLAVVVAWIVGMVLRMTFSHGVFLLVLLGVPLGFVAWMFLARQHWWVIVPIAFAFGGKVYAGVRLFSYELAMLLAASALIPLYLIQALRTMPRPRVPLMVWLLLGYLFVHCTYSVAMEHAGSSGGEGNILRVYFRGIWPLLFAIAFTLYGSTQALRTCLAGMFAFTFVRAALVVLGYYYPYLVYGYVFRYFMPTAAAIGADLRHSSALLITFSLAYLVLPHVRIAIRALHLILIPTYVLLSLIGGSRAALATLVTTIGFWLLVKRKVVALAVVGTTFVVIVAALNINPDMLYSMPYRFRRTLSILVLKSETTAVHAPLASSDRWHFYLGELARENWLHHAGTVCFGNRVRGFDESFMAQGASWRGRAEIAAQMGYYESGLWTILGVLGLVGAVFYGGVLIGLLRLPVLRLCRGPPQDLADAFAFIAVVSAFNWLLFCWIAGHFPSGEIMFAAIARAAYYDRELGLLDEPENAVAEA